MAWTNFIYDSRGRFFGFNDNDAEATDVAASIGGRVEATEVEDNDYNNDNYSGCPHCGSHEGDYQECPECGHGQ